MLNTLFLWNFAATTGPLLLFAKVFADSENRFATPIWTLGELDQLRRGKVELAATLVLSGYRQDALLNQDVDPVLVYSEDPTSLSAPDERRLYRQS